MSEQKKTMERKELIKTIGLCVSEYHGWADMPEDIIRKHFSDYIELGVRAIRTGISWLDLQPRSGEDGWITLEEWKKTNTYRYLKLMKEMGLKAKFGIGTIGERPAWFPQEHPEAYIVDQYGERALDKTISYWMLDFPEYSYEVMRRGMTLMKDADLLDVIGAFMVDFGPAGEPHYPAGTGSVSLGAGVDGIYGKPSVWCYADNAQENFRQEMKKKYSSIENANATWGTNYPDFATISVPHPKTVTGALWRDVLYWYRDSKDRFVEKQIQNGKAIAKEFLGDRAQMLIYCSGSDIRDSEFEAAISNGTASQRLCHMFDTRFMIEMANKYDCWLQFTGADDIPESGFIRKYLNEKGWNHIPVIAENAGDFRPVHEPMITVQNIIDQHFAGFDYTHTRYMYEDDFITHTETYDRFKAAMDSLMSYMTTEKFDIPPVRNTFNTLEAFLRENPFPLQTGKLAQSPKAANILTKMHKLIALLSIPKNENWGQAVYQAALLCPLTPDEELKPTLFDAICRYADKAMVQDRLSDAEKLGTAARLYLLTGKKHYLEVASRIAGAFPLQLIDPTTCDKEKLYDVITGFEGITEYYRIIKEEKYLNAVIDFYTSLASSERIYSSKAITDSWATLCWQLLQLTGKGDVAEALQSAVNAKTAGDLTALLYNASYFMYADAGFVYNFYHAGEIQTITPIRQPITLKTSVDDQDECCITIEVVSVEKWENFALVLHIPSDCKKATVLVNGGAVNAPAGEYISLHRTWEAGDKVELTFMK